VKLLRFSVLALGVPALLLTGCLNIFKPLSSPGGDAQILADARACFDKGDMDCALRNYQRLSSDLAAISSSEQVYLSLSQQGANMAAYMEFVGNGTGGAALTKFAQRLYSGAGLSKRTSIYNSFAATAYATAPASRTDLQNFTVFVASLALAGEILAEAAGSDGVLRKSNLVVTPGSCLSNGTGCVATGNVTTTDCLSATASTCLATVTAGATPNADQLFFAIQYAYNAINQLGASGSFSGSNGLGAVIALGGRPSTGTDALFRGQLLNFGVGEQ
jgi:hypothetical protein